MNGIITIRGERGLWIDFTHKVKKDKKQVWQVLSPFLKKYILSDEETRVLLLLFPKDLVDELLKKKDPDNFIEQALRTQLKK